MREDVTKLWEDLDKVARSRGTTVQELVSYIASVAPTKFGADNIDLSKPNDLMSIFYAVVALPGVRLSF